MCLENQSIPLTQIEGMGKTKKVEVLLQCGASRCTIQGQSVIGRGKFWSMSSSPRSCLQHEFNQIADGLVRGTCHEFFLVFLFICCSACLYSLNQSKIHVLNVVFSAYYFILFVIMQDINIVYVCVYIYLACLCFGMGHIM